MKVIVRPEAAADIRAAWRWYEQQRPGLGDDLLDSLDEVFTRLEAFPQSAPEVAGYPDLRRCRVRGVPYGVFYRLAPNQLDVLRVIDASRQENPAG